jgi:hypothetical protein
MAGKFINAASASITAATSAGYITVSSTTPFYKKAVIWLSASGQPSLRGVITEVKSSTQLGIVFRTNDAGEAPNYGRSDVSAYSSGTITQEEQLIYNTDDKPLD